MTPEPDVASRSLDEPIRAHPSRQVRVPTSIAVYTMILAGITIGVLTITAEPGLATAGSWHIPWLALVAAFAATEATALNVEIRREAHTVSLSSLPLLVGLVTSSPIELVTARLLGFAVIALFIRRSAILKTGWNLSLVGAESSLAFLIVRTFVGTGQPDGGLDWMLVLAGLLAAELFSLVAVPLVIMISSQRVQPELLAQIGRSHLLAALTAAFAVVAGAAALQSPALLVLACVPVLGIALLLRVLGRLGKEHDDLQQVHGFTIAIAGPDPLDIGLRRLAEILRANGAAIVHRDADNHLQLRVFTSYQMSDRVLEPTHDAPFPSDVISSTSSEMRPAWLDAVARSVGAEEVLATGIPWKGSENAAIVAFDRLGTSEQFSAEETMLFGSLCRTLGARLSTEQLLERLEIQALEDSLTGLANRHAFEQFLDERSTRTDEPACLLLLDIDRFKDVNDTLGHQVGDDLLRSFADRLAGAVRNSDQVARLSGDEFAVWTDLADADNIVERVESLTAKLCGPTTLEGISFDVSVSTGIVRFPEHGTGAAELLRRADVAMYEAKRTQQPWYIYDPTIDKHTPRRLQLAASLREGIQAGEIDVHLQPKVDFASRMVVGAEALVRWNHPEHGLVSPGEFVPIVEQSGLAGDLTRAVLRAALRDLRALHGVYPELTVAVNLTARDVLDPGIPQDVADILTEFDLPGTALVLEVTESSMVVDFETGVDTLERLRAQGCKVAIDDFGTGYASLSYLQRLPADELKIDRSFVARCAVNAQDHTIVLSTINLAHDLGLVVVGEGVEDVRTAELLASMGCDLLQGFLVARPLPLGDFADWMLDWQSAKESLGTWPNR
ncbi:MAG: bifunctional diguanylate cyclase/phosphodiesterase [Actinomycetia bacterium]|nr:bifunctional diguanylate cyclase/phosphodiesterase [Actinomycetes bacterium]